VREVRRARDPAQRPRRRRRAALAVRQRRPEGLRLQPCDGTPAVHRDVPGWGEGSPSRPAGFRLAGRVVAYEEVLVESDRQPNDYRIVIRDGRRGRLLRRVRPYEGNARYRSFARGQGIRDVVVTRRGKAAWIIRNPYANVETFEVYRLVGPAIERLDAGDGIAPRSLRRDGCRMRWEHGAETRTSELC
jgi:hypothetical protein